MSIEQTKKSFSAGEIIMKQGELGESAYIIEDGRVEIVLNKPDGGEQIVGTRGPGTIIGEMAIVDNAPRTATVRAIEDCVLLEITQNDFSRRLSSADPVLKMISQVILTRYRDTLTRAEITKDSQNWPPAEAVELNYAEETHAVEKIKIANEFQDALKNNQLSLHYQPIVNMATGNLCGFEALMRWIHPEKGFIPPDLFIPIAEDSGLIVEASKWALDESCQALKRIESKTGYEHDLFMSVNFSSTDFAADGFVESVYNTVSKHDIPPQQIHLEITERLLMGQPDNARDTLSQCRQAGMSISIDDFGTGYSSLSYLHYFPIDTLKIDRSFVCQMNEDESAMALIKSIIALGKNMKMHIIAEGVEEKEEAETLAALGCDMAQGYYFARPSTEQDVIAFIHEQKKI
ncbi:EAL domain-containing protein [Alphaproteobacteria bacterium]|nr:EAL domain-containing protein [Alphaproteobacteria bacterium]